MDLWRYGKFRKRQTVSYGSEPRIPVQKKCRTCGSDGLRGWRHGIRRAHKVTIDLGKRVQEAGERYNGPRVILNLFPLPINAIILPALTQMTRRNAHP